MHTTKIRPAMNSKSTPRIGPVMTAARNSALGGVPVVGLSSRQVELLNCVFPVQ